ncbi:MAG: DUF84 family protein [Gammaproteobacteria bacterium]|nr:DUF84 family protein [Gammaproteobacteria bacterium]
MFTSASSTNIATFQKESGAPKNDSPIEKIVSLSHFFKPASVTSEEKHTLQLGHVSVAVPLCRMPDHSGYFFYFKLNDHPELVEEGARLIAERIKASGVLNPYFVTPEASTLALAHVLRHTYKIQGITLYKTRQINDKNPICVEYDTVTALEKKKLYLGENKIAELKGKSIFILDSVCTSGGTVRATYDLLIKAGVSANNIVEATMLFNEGRDISTLNVGANTSLSIHRFAHLPLFSKQDGARFFSSPVVEAKLKIVVASESVIKLDAVKKAVADFYQNQNVIFEIIGVTTVSGVGEQPFNDETARGAANRLSHAESLIPNADMYIAIENGLFEEAQRFFDKAIIKIKTKAGDEKTEESIKVEFPAQYVEEAKSLGFDKTTVGACLHKAGKVKDAKDPHADLGDKISRAVILTDSVQAGLKGLSLVPSSSQKMRR